MVKFLFFFPGWQGFSHIKFLPTKQMCDGSPLIMSGGAGLGEGGA